MPHVQTRNSYVQALWPRPSAAYVVESAELWVEGPNMQPLEIASQTIELGVLLSLQKGNQG